MHGRTKVLKIALALNASYLVVELAGGVAVSSLALLADAGHMLSDVVALGIALAGQHLASAAGSKRHTYGLVRAEVLAALLNGIVLVAVSGGIVFEAVRRIGNPAEVRGWGLLVVAGIGLMINLGSAKALHAHQGHSLNMRAAFIHMMADAAGSAGAIAAGVAVVVAGANWADPIASIVISVLILMSSAKIIRSAVHVLLEGAPAGVDPAQVEEFLQTDEAVAGVHHVHVWSLASDTPALSAHVVLKESASLHDAQQSGDRLRTALAQRFGIGHTTLELECHDCEKAVH